MTKKHPKKVLVVDIDSERTKALAALLHFLDYEAQVLSSPELLRQSTNLTDYGAVFLHEAAGALGIAKDLNKQLSTCPPLILVSEDSEFDRPDDE